MRAIGTDLTDLVVSRASDTARQSATTGTTRVFVVTERGSDGVVAYYAWCIAQIHISLPLRSDFAVAVAAIRSRWLFSPVSACTSTTRDEDIRRTLGS